MYSLFIPNCVKYIFFQWLFLISHRISDLQFVAVGYCFIPNSICLITKRNIWVDLNPIATLFVFIQNNRKILGIQKN